MASMEDPRQSDTDRVHDNIAARAKRQAEQFPEGVALEAAVLVAMWGELHGVASRLCGIHAAEHFREGLRGVRSLPFGEFCRLAADPRKEARDAVAAALRVLAEAIGERMVPAEARPSTIPVAAVVFMKAANGLSETEREAIADGQYSAKELTDMEHRVQETKRETARLEMAIAEHRRGQ
jgi:hypothetical protein